MITCDSNPNIVVGPLPQAQGPIPGPSLGINLQWPAVTNSRTFVTDGGPFAEMNMYFTTPANVGQKVVINALGYSSYPDIFRTWTLYKTDGTVLVQQVTQTAHISVVVGPSINAPGFFGGIAWYGLAPNTTYKFTSRNVDKNGANQCQVEHCNFVVDMNRATS